MRNLFIVAAVTIIAVLPAFANTRSYTDDAGNIVEIPTDPKRIVSVRGEQFTSPLWELGANIVASSGRVDKGVNDGKPYPRGAYDIFGIDFENTDLKWIGSPNEPDFEAIAAVQPDLILIPDWQGNLYDKFSAIAPTVVIDVWGNTLLERYQRVADVANVLPQYKQRLALLHDQLELGRAVVADMIGEPSQVSIAIVEPEQDKLYIYNSYASLTYVIKELGFTMPQIALDAEESYKTLSPELLPETDADFLFGTYNYVFNQSPSDRYDEWESIVPGWDRLLHAPRNNQYVLIDREKMRGVSFRAIETTLAIVLSNVASRRFVPLGK